MFKHLLLFVWLAVIGMFAIAGLIRPPLEGTHITHASSKTETAEQGEAQTRPYWPNCERPKDHNDADVCVQRRMANAAEQQNQINTWALIALVATLFATGIAAVAAWVTVRTMQETAKRELRAYINLDNATVTVKDGEFMFRATLKNYGQTPAHSVVSIRAVRPFELPVTGAPDLTAIDDETPAGTIGPGTDIILEDWMPRLSEADRTSLSMRKYGLFYFGRIRYVDAFGNFHQTDFCQFMTGNVVEGMDQLLAHSAGNDAD